MADRIEQDIGKHAVAGLNEVLHALGAELRQASATTAEQTLVFANAEIELDVAIESNASGGLNFWVVDLKGGATYTRTAKVKVLLYPGGGFEGEGVGK